MSQFLKPPKFQRNSASSHAIDSSQKFSEKDTVALQLMFEGFDMSEIECDLHRICEAIVPLSEDWFDLIA